MEARILAYNLLVNYGHMGMVLEVLETSGNIPVENDWFIIGVRDFKIINLIFFRNMFDMLSYPLLANY